MERATHESCRFSAGAFDQGSWLASRLLNFTCMNGTRLRRTEPGWRVAAALFAGATASAGIEWWPQHWGSREALALAAGIFGAVLVFAFTRKLPPFSLGARDPAMRVRAQVMLDRVSRVEETLDENHATARKTCAQARKVLEREISRPTSPLRWYAAYDAVWEVMYLLRHELCEVLPAKELSGLLLEIAEDREKYLSESKRRETKDSWKNLQTALTGNVSVVDDVVRAKLRAFSQEGADARQARWRKVNRLRARLSLTILLLAAVTVVLIVLLPSGWSPKAEGLQMHRSLLLMAATCGASGGLLSALQAREQVSLPSEQFYVEQLILYMRPVVGALAGVLLYIAQASDLLRVGPSKTTLEVSLFVAFAGGFSERVLLARLSSIKGLVDEKEANKTDAPAAATS